MLVAVHVLAWRETEFSPAALVQGWPGMVDFLDGAIPPDLNWHRVLAPGLSAALVTFYIGLLGTTLSTPFAFLVALAAARATTRSTRPLIRPRIAGRTAHPGRPARG